MAESSRAQLKKTAKHSAIYAVGTILRRITGLVMLPIYTRYLTPEDYGAVELLAMAIEVMGILIGLRISQALFRFYILEDDPDQKRRIVSTVLTTIIISSSLGAFILYWYAASLTQLIFGTTEYIYEFQLFALTLMTNAIIAVGLSYLRAIQRPVLFVSIGLFSLLTQVAMNLYFVVHLELHVTGVVYSAVISGAIIATGLSLYVFASVGLGYSLEIAKRLIRYVAPLMLASLGAFYVAYADKYFLRVFAGLTEVGLYTLAARVTSVLMTVFEAFNMSWAADRFEVVKQEGAQAIFEQMFRLVCAFLFVGAAGLSIFADDFFRIMTTPDFYPASALVPLFCLAVIAKIFTIYCNFGVLYRDRTSVIAQASWMRAVVATVGYLSLIPVLGVYGAVISLAASAVLEFLWVYSRSQKLYDLGLNWSRVSLLFVLTVVSVVVGLMFEQGEMSGFLARCAVFLALIVGLYYLPVWTEDERGMMRAVIARVLRRKRAGAT